MGTINLPFTDDDSSIDNLLLVRLNVLCLWLLLERQSIPWILRQPVSQNFHISDFRGKRVSASPRHNFTPPPLSLSRGAAGQWAFDEVLNDRLVDDALVIIQRG